MCNEYSFTQTLDALREQLQRRQLQLNFEGGAPNLEPRTSVRPTEGAPVIVGASDGALLKQLRWGFTRPQGGPIINFRSDGRRFASGRCLIPMDGFYEFTGEKAPKAKWRFEKSAGGFFLVAGLIREDRFTLLTMPPGPDIAPYHDRQIAILPKVLWADWLDVNKSQPELPALPAGSLTPVRVR